MARKLGITVDGKKCQTTIAKKIVLLPNKELKDAVNEL
jgi:hypothetical protein